MTVKVNAQTNLPTSTMLRDGEHPTLLSYHAVVTTTPTDIVTATPTEVQPNAAARAAMDHTTPKVLGNSEKYFSSITIFNYINRERRLSRFLHGP